MHDLIIMGGGPAAVAAGVYAARKKLKLLVSADVQNWIGTKSVSGLELGKMLEEHLRSQDGAEVLEDSAIKIGKNSDSFGVETQGGKKFNAKTVLVATGSRRRKLRVPGEKEFDGKGVAYCSTCDAPLFKNK